MHFRMSKCAIKGGLGKGSGSGEDFEDGHISPGQVAAALVRPAAREALVERTQGRLLISHPQA